MKSLVLLLALSSASPALADELSRDFAAASERALAGDRVGAIGLYESLLERGAVHPDVYFNLGNALAREDRKLDAVIAYERALRLAPNDDDIRANLKTVRAAMLGDDAATSPDELGVADVLDPIVSPIPSDITAYLLVGMNFVLVLLIAVSRRKRRPIAVFVTTALVLVLAALTASHAIVAADPRGVVIQSVALKRGPNARYENRGTATAGARIRLLEHEAGWVNVQNVDGTSGWLLEKQVQPI